MKKVKIGEIKNLEDYHDFIQADKAVIKVGAAWCGPCHTQSEKIEDLDYTRVKDIAFAEVDADECDLCDFIDDMNITILPTLILYMKGKAIAKSTGVKGGWELYELFKLFDGGNPDGVQFETE